MQDRRQHDRRIDDCEDKLREHISKADERWESIEVHIAEIREILKELDTQSLKAVSDVMQGAVSFKKFVIGLASVVVALSAIGGAIIWIIKQAIK